MTSEPLLMPIDLPTTYLIGFLLNLIVPVDYKLAGRDQSVGIDFVSRL